MSIMLSERQTESRSWMSPSPNDGQKMSKETRHGFMFLTCGGSYQRSVALKRRVEKCMSSSTSCGM